MTIEDVSLDDDAGFAVHFAEYREKNIRAPVERYTINRCLLKPCLNNHGLLTGKRVLDLACGHGLYTRHLKSLKAEYVLGVDISPPMIEHAREIEHKNPQGVEYQVANAAHLPPPVKSFDLVTGFYLLDYAQTLDELVQMVRTIHTQLGTGKQFIGLIGNVVQGKKMFNQRKYGIVRETKVPLDEDAIPDGTEVLITLYDARDEPISKFINYHYSPKTYEKVFREAGFRTFEWVPYQYDATASDRAFYDDLIECAPTVGIIATK